MADSYQYCPCGSGEKIKHCCDRSLQNELTKILDMLQNGQQAAAVQRVQQLVGKNPNDPCLLSLQLQLDFPAHLPTEQRDEFLRDRVGRLEKAAPQHLTTLTGRLMLALVAGDGEDMAGAMEALYIRIREVGAITPFAREILQQAVLQSPTATNVLTTWYRLLTWDYVVRTSNPDFESELLSSVAQRLPTLLRDDWLARLLGDAEEYDDQESFTKLIERAIAGEWQGVAADVEKLLADGGDRLECVGLMAWLLTALGRSAEAASWWDRYASHAEVTYFASALAAYNATTVNAEPEIYVETIREISDYAAVNEALRAAPQISTSMNIPESAAQSFSPPPRLRITVLDRVAPSAEEFDTLTPETVPHAIASGFMFGKETDREARVMVVGPQTHHDQALKALSDAAGEWIAEEGEDNDAPQTADPLGAIPMFWFPEKVSPAKRQSLHNDCIAWVRGEGALDIPSPLLNGRTPRQAGQEDVPANRREAYFFTLNLGLDVPYTETETWAKLRETLALPAIRSIDAGDLDLQLDWNMIPFADWTATSIELLLQAGMTSVEHGVKQGLAATTDEFLRRADSGEAPSNDESQQALLEALLRQRLDVIGAGQEAIDWLDKVLASAPALGLAEGQWLVNRWVLMLATENETGTRETWDRLQPHLSDPEVAGRVQSLLIQMGVMNQDGTMNAPPEALAGGGQPVAAESNSGVWTPDSPAEPSEEKSKLWLPGQD
jgi:hypothetical protein